jgi:hypothetical protein
MWMVSTLTLGLETGDIHSWWPQPHPNHPSHWTLLVLKPMVTTGVILGNNHLVIRCHKCHRSNSFWSCWLSQLSDHDLGHHLVGIETLAGYHHGQGFWPSQKPWNSLVNIKIVSNGCSTTQIYVYIYIYGGWKKSCTSWNMVKFPYNPIIYNVS